MGAAMKPFVEDWNRNIISTWYQCTMVERLEDCLKLLVIQGLLTEKEGCRVRERMNKRLRKQQEKK